MACQTTIRPSYAIARAAVFLYNIPCTYMQTVFKVWLVDSWICSEVLHTMLPPLILWFSFHLHVVLFTSQANVSTSNKVVTFHIRCLTCNNKQLGSMHVRGFLSSRLYWVHRVDINPGMEQNRTVSIETRAILALVCSYIFTYLLVWSMFHCLISWILHDKHTYVSPFFHVHAKCTTFCLNPLSFLIILFDWYCFSMVRWYPYKVLPFHVNR